MKRILFLLIALIILSAVFNLAEAQYVKPQPNLNPEASDFYLVFSSGIDNYTGILGIGVMFPFNDQFALRAGVGIGGWGGKISAGVKYENLLESGFGFGLGYSHCTGVKEIDLELQDQSGGSRSINMDLLPVGSVNLTINKNWVFKRGNVFYLESGYAIATGSGDYYKVNDGKVLVPDEELILRIMRPGGLVLSTGFLLAF